MDKLRRARDTLDARIAEIDHQLPPERTTELERVEADLAGARRDVINARDRLDGAHDALAEASLSPEGWDGATGYVDAELLDRVLPAHPERLEHFLCGPAPMMDAVTDALISHRVPLERIHSERFDFI